jgi:hypothetical protein
MVGIGTVETTAFQPVTRTKLITPPYEKLGSTPDLRNESQSESYVMIPIGIDDGMELIAAIVDRSGIMGGIEGSYMLGASLTRDEKSSSPGLPMTIGSGQYW